ncbi:unnamed protein product [Lactuca virosa]|uniref:Uncharacterized protein n=1 Tax=Lactuca virosa TaxID=75947 RepID=A0AAU9M5P4_9ASTR|nr:unnamed protein product [Lactuca virosa]
MVDVDMANIQKINTSTFVTSDSRNFHIIGLIPEVMLARVLMDGKIIQIYSEIPKFGERAIPPALQAILDVGDAPKWVGVKKKENSVAEVQSTKSKAPKKRQTKKFKPTIFNEESDDTLTDVRINDDIQTGDTTTNECKIPKHTPGQEVHNETPKVSTPIPTTFVSTFVENQSEENIYQTALENPILNL